MRNQEINEKIIDLWKKNFKTDSDVKVPMFYDLPSDGGILFIGMNPSDSEMALNVLLKESIVYTPEIIKDLLSYKSFCEYKDKAERVGFLTEAEKVWQRNLYPFFKPMKDIADQNNTFFQHLDLFLYRETNQKDFEKLVIKKESEGNIEFNDFGNDQIEIFKELLDQYTPKVIVVANAMASKIFKQIYKNDLIWDEEKGYHLFKNDTPIFFTSMLSGQRAIDIHSRERLEWQIRQTLK